MVYKLAEDTIVEIPMEAVEKFCDDNLHTVISATLISSESSLTIRGVESPEVLTESSLLSYGITNTGSKIQIKTQNTDLGLYKFSLLYKSYV